MNEDLIKKISILAEGYLFWAAEPLSKKTLLKHISEHIGVDIEKDVGEKAFEHVQQKLAHSDAATMLVISTDEVELRLKTDISPFIESLEKHERGRELGKAGMETLAIIMYEGGATRRRIEYIRGVNAQFTLRSLLMRGLIAKTEKEGERSTVYIPTTETLSFLGITSLDQLPHAAEFAQTLQTLQVKEEDEKG